MKFSDLQAQVHKTAVTSGWHDKERSFSDFIALFHSEVSEAFEEYRSTGYITPKVLIELADVIIRIMDFCELYNYDLEGAIVAKDVINQERPYRHGNKAL